MIQYRTTYEYLPMSANNNIIMLHEVKYKQTYNNGSYSNEFAYIRPVMINLNFVTNIEPSHVENVDEINSYISIFKTCTYHIAETIEEINELINGKNFSE